MQNYTLIERYFTLHVNHHTSSIFEFAPFQTKIANGVEKIERYAFEMSSHIINNRLFSYRNLYIPTFLVGSFIGNTKWVYRATIFDDSNATDLKYKIFPIGNSIRSEVHCNIYKPSSKTNDII